MLSPRQYLIILIVADVVMIGIFIVVANVHVPLQPNLIRQFNPDAEGNLASWYASSKLLTAALMIAVVAAVNEYKKLAPILLALILFFLSADEAAQIHEELGLAISLVVTPKGIAIPGTPSAHDWPYLFAPPALLLISAVMFWIKRNGFFERRTWARFVLGFAILFAGAVGAEIVEQYLNWEIWKYAWVGPAPTATLLEELVENFGNSLLIWASAYAIIEALPVYAVTSKQSESSGKGI